MYILEYEPWQLFSLIAIGTASIVCAFAGLKRLTKQTDNQTSVVLTIIGLIGTMYPAVIIFICIVALRAAYRARLSHCVPCCIDRVLYATIQMRKRNIEYRRKLREAEGLIFRCGNL